MGNLIYVGTYTDHGSDGIYSCRFDSKTGKLAELGLAAESSQPSFLAVYSSAHFLYAVNEIKNFNGLPSGAVSSFAIDSATGKLSLLNQVSSRGGGPAHIILDQTEKHAFVSNYKGGSMAVLPVLEDGRLGEASAFVQNTGSSVNKKRQEGPHAHAVAMSCDNRFALLANLGLDQLIAYPFDSTNGMLGQEPNVTKTNPGSGPRHVVFDHIGKFLYVINELQSSVTTYSYDSIHGALHDSGTISTLPQGFAASNDAGEIAIHPSGKFIYASNRGHDSIAVFSIDPAKGTLTNIEFIPTRGKTPRNFAIDPTGLWLIAANQESDDIVVFRIDGKTGRLVPTGQSLHVPSPACVTFVPQP